MPRVIGIDPGTVSVDLCGLDDGRVFLDRSLPTSEALANPSVLVELLDAASPLDLWPGRRAMASHDGRPRSDGRPAARLPCRRWGVRRHQWPAIADARSRACARLLTPGSCISPRCPHRKVNRSTWGRQTNLRGRAGRSRAGRATRPGERDVSFILLELGGAFLPPSPSTAVVLSTGSGSSGPLGLPAAAPLDGKSHFCGHGDETVGVQRRCLDHEHARRVG